jgi:hypothetical protein
MFRVGGGRVCGRTTSLFVEQKGWRPAGWWDPADFRLICVYHLRDGYGLKLVDWRDAARA